MHNHTYTHSSTKLKIFPEIELDLKLDIISLTAKFEKRRKKQTKLIGLNRFFSPLNLFLDLDLTSCIYLSSCRKVDGFDFLHLPDPAAFLHLDYAHSDTSRHIISPIGIFRF